MPPRRPEAAVRAAATARAEARQRAATLTALQARETKRLQAAGGGSRPGRRAIDARGRDLPSGRGAGQRNGVRPLFVALLGFAVLMVLLALTPAPAAFRLVRVAGDTRSSVPAWLLSPPGSHSEWDVDDVRAGRLAVRTGRLFLALASAAILTVVVIVPSAGAAGPSVSISAGPVDPTADTTPSFSFDSADDPLAIFECQLDGGGFSVCASPKSYSSLGDGDHTFQVRATNLLLETGAAASYGWTIDTSAPPAPTVTGPTGTIVDPTPSFTFSSAGATSYLCAFDDATPAAVCTSPKTASPALGDGPHTFSAIARDALNNASAVSTVSFTVDSSPPPAPTVTGPTGTIVDPTPSFTFSSAGATSYLCAFDDATPAAVCTSPKTASPGLWATAPTPSASSPATRSTTHPPSAPCRSPSTRLRRRCRPWAAPPARSPTRRRASPSPPGASSYLCAFDDPTPAAVCTSPKTAPSALGDGPHTFSAIARDALNNTSAVKTVSFTVDTTAPPPPTLGGVSGTTGDKTPTSRSPPPAPRHISAPSTM